MNIEHKIARAEWFLDVTRAGILFCAVLLAINMFAINWTAVIIAVSGVAILSVPSWLLMHRIIRFTHQQKQLAGATSNSHR